MSIGKKLAHKAEAIKGATKKISAAPPATPGCAPRAAPISPRPTPNRQGPKSKTPSSTDSRPGPQLHRHRN